MIYQKQNLVNKSMEATRKLAPHLNVKTDKIIKDLKESITLF
jgi:hypothetical protein